MTSSSVSKRVVEACSDGNGIGSYRISYYRCVDLLTNKIYDSLVEIYSRLIDLKMDDLKGYMDSYISEAGQEYEGKMNLYLARLYISAFFHDLYVANRFACRQQQGCSDAYNKQYYKDMVYLSRTYDCFLAHLLGSILPTEIKHIHGSTVFIPLINPNIRRGDDNQNYLGITNWVYNNNCLNQFINLCGRLRIMNMQHIPESVNGRPFWLFDWHDSSCYSWFSVESNYAIEDVVMAYMIGTACTARLALRDYDEWQEFPSNIRPIKVHANDYERVRGLVYHGSKLVRTIELQSYVIPQDIVGQVVVKKPGSAGASPSEQKQGKGKQLSDESTNEQEVHQLSQRISEKISPSVVISNIEQFRIVDYLYHSKVIGRHEEHRRWEAWVEMVWNNQTTPGISVNSLIQDNMTSSVPKRVVEVCCERIQLDMHRGCHHRYVDLLRNEMYESLVEIYSSWIMQNMGKLEDFEDAYLNEAGEEYKGKFYLYLARLYISAFFYDLYVSNLLARKQLCIDIFVEHHDKDLIHLSWKYDRFLVHLLGSILPTEIKVAHERTLFIPQINSDIQFNDVNHNYFGINNWVYNRSILFGFIGSCEHMRIMDMRPLPESKNGRPFWLFDWHGNKCYSWFPVEPNCTIDDVAMAYVIGTACTSRPALTDYDEWQQFPNNVRSVEAHPNYCKRLRDLVYRGSARVRTMEERSFIIPGSVLASPVVKTCEEASPAEPDQENSNFCTRKKQRLAETNLCMQTCSYATGIETDDHQLVGSGHMGEEGEDSSIVLVPNIEQFRCVDYLYDSIVISKVNERMRSKALVEMLRNDPNQE